MFAEHSPSIGEHLKDFAILFQASVTCVFCRKSHGTVQTRWDSEWLFLEMKRAFFTWFPGLTRRSAASAQRCAALMTSAFRPVTGLSWGFPKAKLKTNTTTQTFRLPGVMTHLGCSHHEAMSHVWDEAVNMHAQISADKLCTWEEKNKPLTTLETKLH